MDQDRTPSGAAAGGRPAAAPRPHPEATVELPIFTEMEQSWFRSHGDIDLDRRAPSPREPRGDSGGATGSAPPAPAVAEQAPSAPPAESWRTAADSGWRAAEAAAQPTSGGATRSGLPKRVPQAQLVPGSVETPVTSATRRSPEEIRGLLSAYHRGVQRGRESGGR